MRCIKSKEFASNPECKETAKSPGVTTQTCYEENCIKLIFAKRTFE